MISPEEFTELGRNMQASVSVACEPHVDVWTARRQRRRAWAYSLVTSGVTCLAITVAAVVYVALVELKVPYSLTPVKQLCNAFLVLYNGGEHV
jgi:hypothetical protein